MPFITHLTVYGPRSRRRPTKTPTATDGQAFLRHSRNCRRSKGLRTLSNNKRPFRYSDFTEVVTESRNYMVGFRNQWTKDDARLGGTAE